MNPRLSLAATLVACGLFGHGASNAHPGGLDDNGCHYEHGRGKYHCHQDVPPNMDTRAVAKKSRDNVCHDVRSPNYRNLRYFISFRDMDACLASGGVEHRR